MDTAVRAKQCKTVRIIIIVNFYQLLNSLTLKSLCEEVTSEQRLKLEQHGRSGRTVFQAQGIACARP